MRLLRWLRESFARFGSRMGMLLLWSGGLLLVVAGLAAGHRWWGVRDRLRAVATVTEDVATFAPGGGLNYRARLRFRSAGGDLVTVLAANDADEIEFAPGETVPVMYPAGLPQNAVIATRWRVYKAAIVLAVLGTLLFDVGFVMLVLVWRAKNLRGSAS